MHQMLFSQQRTVSCISQGEGLEGITTRSVDRYQKGHPPEQFVDSLSVEEPVEIRICAPDPKPVAITMRTPGHDLELAVGFLITEGLIDSAKDVLEIDKCSKESSVVSVRLKKAIDLEGLKRHFYTSSSCGVCGKAAISALRVRSRYQIEKSWRIPAEKVSELPARLNELQRQFQSTGGLHASALFSQEGKVLALREDVGRHNALDKLIGWAEFQAQLPLSGNLLMLSGRASFELIQKASMAGIPLIVAIGAPSTLAVELAEEMNMTLIGFARNDRFNIYTHPDRILP